MVINLACMLLVSALLSILCVIASDAATITIDPGHSYSKPGAVSCSGIGEVYFNDILASHVAAALQKAGYTVRLTRTGKESPSLLQRAASAKSSSLFLSLHHDSVQSQFLQHYTDLNGKDHLCSQYAKGYSIFVSRKNAKAKQSKAIAISIARHLREAGFTVSTHHAQDIPGERKELVSDALLGVYYFDDLVVLKHAPAPAVLVEAGVIVNPEDEQASGDAGAMTVFSAAITQALKGY